MAIFSLLPFHIFQFQQLRRRCRAVEKRLVNRLAHIRRARRELLCEAKIRTFLKLPPALAPVKAAIFPLVRKDGMPEKAQEIFDELKFDFRLVLEERDAIGKRYTRQDLIGTPFCIVVDGQTLEDNTVTVRHRDSREQTRMPIADLRSYIGEAVSFRRIFEQL